MQLEKATWRPVSRTFFLVITVLFSASTIGQINSPYSRYGIGDLYVGRPVSAKGMAGIASAYSDPLNINFINPASYSRIQLSTFDVGLETEWRTLRDPRTNDIYTSGNLVFNSLAIGIPIMRDKKTGRSRWGMAMGLRPVSRISYRVEEFNRLPGIDSARTLYEGNGGTFRGFVGTGFRVGGLSLGVNGGFYFGQEDISTKRTLLNDSVFYFQTNYLNKISFARFALDAGMQYEAKIGTKHHITVGANGFLGTKINAKSDILRETFIFNASGGTDSVDLVFNEENVRGTIQLPSGYSAGLSFERDDKYLIAAEYETTNWNNFSFFGQQGNVRNTSMLRIGAQFLPNVVSKKYFNQVSYRTGFYTGKDYVVDKNGQQLPVWGITVGAGFPIRNYNAYVRQTSFIHTSLEFGFRGSNENTIRERFLRLNASFTLSDLWFIKRRFD